MRLLLTAISGSRQGETFTIDPGNVLTFGRTDSADISFPQDGHMSSMHFEVNYMGSEIEVVDRGSTNGTWLNDRRISAAILQPNDLLRAGKTVLQVEMESAGTAARPPDRDDSWIMPVGPADSPFVPADPPVQAPPAPVNPSNFESFSPGLHQQPVTGVEQDDFPPRSTTRVERAAPVSHSGSASRGPGGTAGDNAGPGGEPVSPSVPPKSPPLPASQRPVPPPKPPAANKFSGSPIESLDLSSSVDLRNLVESDSPPHVTPPDSPGVFSDNPFSDASVSFSAAPATPVTPPVPRPDTVRHQARELIALHRFPPEDLSGTFEYVLATLARNFALKLVTHFRKIRTAPPTAFSVAPAVSDFFGSSPDGTCSPVLLDATSLNEAALTGVLPRLCRADAVAAFVGVEGKRMESAIIRMVNSGVEGFSEEGGLLPLCWPSGLMVLAQTRGLESLQKILGPDLMGVVFCTPEKKPRVLAYAQGAMQEQLLAMEFLP